MLGRQIFATAFLICLTATAGAQIPPPDGEDHSEWKSLKPEFESTGGGGIMIRGYSPVVLNNECRTNFTATEPSGAVHKNSVVIDASPAQGGMLCFNGKWRADDGSATGTTPLSVFIKDGIARRSP